MFRWVWVRAAYGFLQGEAWWARPGGGGAACRTNWSGFWSIFEKHRDYPVGTLRLVP